MQEIFEESGMEFFRTQGRYRASTKRHEVILRRIGHRLSITKSRLGELFQVIYI